MTKLIDYCSCYCRRATMTGNEDGDFKQLATVKQVKDCDAINNIIYSDLH